MTPIYEVRRVKGLRVAERLTCDHTQHSLALARKELHGLDRERLLCIYLNAQNVVMGLETVSIGGENSACATTTTIFRGAIVAGAKAVILAHNHPSGDPTPSPGDLVLKAKIETAGEILECPLLDFLIVTDGAAHYSSAEAS